jgi:hypothetical protein
MNFTRICRVSNKCNIATIESKNVDLFNHDQEIKIREQREKQKEMLPNNKSANAHRSRRASATINASSHAHSNSKLGESPRDSPRQEARNIHQSMEALSTKPAQDATATTPAPGTATPATLPPVRQVNRRATRRLSNVIQSVPISVAIDLIEKERMKSQSSFREMAEEDKAHIEPAKKASMAILGPLIENSEAPYS